MRMGVGVGIVATILGALVWLVLSVGNSGNQPYTTSGLAITPTLSEDFTSCILLLRASSVRPCGLFQHKGRSRVIFSNPLSEVVFMSNMSHYSHAWLATSLMEGTSDEKISDGKCAADGGAGDCGRKCSSRYFFISFGGE